VVSSGTRNGPGQLRSRSDRACVTLADAWEQVCRSADRLQPISTPGGGLCLATPHPESPAHASRRRLPVRPLSPTPLRSPHVSGRELPRRSSRAAPERKSASTKATAPLDGLWWVVRSRRGSWPSEIVPMPWWVSRAKTIPGAISARLMMSGTERLRRPTRRFRRGQASIRSSAIEDVFLDRLPSRSPNPRRSGAPPPTWSDRPAQRQGGHGELGRGRRPARHDLAAERDGWGRASRRGHTWCHTCLAAYAASDEELGDAAA
jgi:hypothetical protein